jgi:hypothetical protein
VAITAPRTDTRFYLDPEMPPGKSLLTLSCKIEPEPASALWLVNGEEYRVTAPPFKLSWPMKPGKNVFQVRVPGTPFKSNAVKIEVY